MDSQGEAVRCMALLHGTISQLRWCGQFDIFAMDKVVFPINVGGVRHPLIGAL